jgi:hypothetical protein
VCVPNKHLFSVNYWAQTNILLPFFLSFRVLKIENAKAFRVLLIKNPSNSRPTIFASKFKGIQSSPEFERRSNKLHPLLHFKHHGIMAGKI